MGGGDADVAVAEDVAADLDVVDGLVAGEDVDGVTVGGDDVALDEEAIDCYAPEAEVCVACVADHA